MPKNSQNIARKQAQLSGRKKRKLNQEKNRQVSTAKINNSNQTKTTEIKTSLPKQNNQPQPKNNPSIKPELMRIGILQTVIFGILIIISFIVN
mgnify:FL=1